MMSFVYRKHKKILYIIFFSLCLNNCQLNAPKKNHGINFLENREKALLIGKTNKNDVIKLIGNPHTTSITENNTWIYFERTITRGKLIKLGQNVLSENNILKLEFNKYDVLINKKILNKKDMKKIKYSKKNTENKRTKQSFVEKFLSSVKQKMYRKKTTKF
jgi:outer membrane protein assembly factor BamE (lipoprotein component of BamABCDE complex)